jgi:hypothetical protein
VFEAHLHQLEIGTGVIARERVHRGNGKFGVLTPLLQGLVGDDVFERGDAVFLDKAVARGLLHRFQQRGEPRNAARNVGALRNRKPSGPRLSDPASRPA